MSCVWKEKKTFRLNENSFLSEFFIFIRTFCQLLRVFVFRLDDDMKDWTGTGKNCVGVSVILNELRCLNLPTAFSCTGQRNIFQKIGLKVGYKIIKTTKN